MTKNWNEVIQSDEFKALSKPEGGLPHAPQVFKKHGSYSLILTRRRLSVKDHEWQFSITIDGFNEVMDIWMTVDADGKQTGEVRFDLTMPCMDVDGEVSLLIAAFLTCQFERILEVMAKNAQAQEDER